MSIYLEALNPSQCEAVQHKDGPLLILAGAGSGKTRVLTHRIAHLIVEHDVAPWQIFAVTFTNKATAEMRSRLAGMLGSKASDIWVSTFHSACLRILRRYHRELGFTSNFSVYDDQDSKNLLKGLLKELGVDSKKYPPRMFLSAFDRAKGDYVLPDEFRKNACSADDELRATVYSEYQRALFRADAMDFGDLLVHVVTLFQKYPALLESYRKKLQYILVDEYQDTNHVQYMFLKMLAQPRNNLLVVGDEDQSIYSFRGADIRNILEFERDFPGAKLIKLEQNYRSTQTILSAANSVIALNSERKGKSLWTDKGAGDPIGLFAGYDETEEARYVCAEIVKLKTEGVALKKIALFYRTNAQSRALEEALINARLPYRIYGGLKFYDRKEIKDVLSYLRLIVNEADEQAFLRVVNTPARGIGPRTIENVGSVAREKGVNFIVASRELAAKQKGLRLFISLYDQFRDAAASISVSELITLVLEKTEYLKSLEEIKDQVSESRIENLKELRGIALGMQQRGEEPLKSLKDFLDRASLTSSAENPDDYAEDSENFISLMTLHLAKGLEFPIVFLTGVEEGLLPHYRSLDDPAGLEEERRLCYVGMTRAMERLFLTRANTRGMFSGDESSACSGYFRLPSRFFKDIPLELIREDDHCYVEQWDQPSDSSDNVFDDDAFDDGVSEKPVAQPWRSKSCMSFIRKKSSKASGTVLPKLRSGSRVCHPGFGPGIVDRIEGDAEASPEQTFVIVQFDDFEEPMKLVLKWSRLSSLD